MDEQSQVDSFCAQLDNFKSLSAISSELVVEIGKEFGERQFEKEKMNQLRKFLDFLKNLEYKYKFDKDGFKKDDLMIMKIYLKNSENKANNKQPWKNITRITDKALSKIRNGTQGFEDLEKLIKVWEAIIAFHKEK